MEEEEEKEGGGGTTEVKKEEVEVSDEVSEEEGVEVEREADVGEEEARRARWNARMRDKVVTILGRTVRWTGKGIEYEADGGHRAKLMKAEGLEEDSKVAVGPAVKVGGGVEAFEEVKLEEAWEHKEFRSKGQTGLLFGVRSKRHPVRSEDDMPRDVNAHGRRECENKESREVLGGSKEVGVEIWGEGGG